jgi:hypothetical protein
MQTQNYELDPKQYGRLVAKAWSDKSFEEQLLADPLSTLQAEGLQLPPGTQVKVVAETASVGLSDGTLSFYLPPKPAELGEQLVASGGPQMACFCMCCGDCADCGTCCGSGCPYYA